MDACSLSRSLHLIVPSCDAAVADIVGNGVIEEDSVLGHDSNVRPERSLGHLGPKDHILWPVRSLQAWKEGWAGVKHISLRESPAFTSPDPSCVGKSLNLSNSVSPLIENSFSLPAALDGCRSLCLIQNPRNRSRDYFPYTNHVPLERLRYPDPAFCSGDSSFSTP